VTSDERCAMSATMVTGRLFAFAGVRVCSRLLVDRQFHGKTNTIHEPTRKRAKLLTRQLTLTFHGLNSHC
jgi:hypothetical protein